MFEELGSLNLTLFKEPLGQYLVLLSGVMSSWLLFLSYTVFVSDPIFHVEKDFMV